jgi:hypothetical protein
MINSIVIYLPLYVANVHSEMFIQIFCTYLELLAYYCVLSIHSMYSNVSSLLAICL